MKKNKISSLELALSRNVEAENTHEIPNSAAFVALAKVLLGKKSTIDAMKDYMKSQQYSPRVLGLMIYTEPGRELVRQWVEQGMDVSYLYHAMINDGLFWQSANAPFPFMYEVATAPGWGFDPKEFFSNTEMLNAIPGLLVAMVERLRREGRIAEVFRHFTRRNLHHLLRNLPELLAPELAALPKGVDYTRVDWEEWAYSDLISVHLDAESAVRKVLGAKVA